MQPERSGSIDLPRRHSPWQSHVLESLEPRNLVSATLLKDINPGKGSSLLDSQNWVTPVGTHVIFSAHSPTADGEIWTTNGTPAGTYQLTHLSPPGQTTYILGTASVGNAALFWARYGPDQFHQTADLFRTDGTATAAPTKFALPGLSGNITVSIIGAKGQAFVLTRDPIGTVSLWRTDTTAGGTVLLKKGLPGTTRFATAVNSSVKSWVLLTSPGTTAHTRTFWISDGTAAGTAALAGLTNVSDAFGSFIPGQNTCFILGNRTVITGGIRKTSELLWRIDCATHRTHAADISSIRTTPLDQYDLNATGCAILSDRCYFFGNSGLYASDGYPGDATLIKAMQPGGDVVVKGGEFYFLAPPPAIPDSRLSVLWTSDGTTAGTRASTYRLNLTNLWLLNITPSGRLLINGQDLVNFAPKTFSMTSISDIPRLENFVAGPGIVLPDNTVFEAAVTTATGLEPWAYSVAAAGAGSLSSISGKVFNDKNGNGKQDAGEGGLAGQKIYIDLSGEALSDGPGDLYATTDSAGNYRFDGLLAGTYPLHILLPNVGASQTYPVYPSPQTAKVGVNLSATNVNFGLHNVSTAANGSISGIIFNNLNGDTIREPGEPGLAGRTVYLDTNSNNRLDPGERTATTDSLGNYKFTGLAPAYYVVSQVLPAGWSQTIPWFNEEIVVMLAPGQSVIGINFGDKKIA